MCSLKMVTYTRQKFERANQNYAIILAIIIKTMILILLHVHSDIPAQP